ncbi:MAG: ELM1/GtrOC1 family putative glycosyltransferase, partial [Planctomycetota bacterium]
GSMPFGGSNRLSGHPPNGIDPASIAALRRPLGGTRTLALLLGGPRRSIRYTPVDWARLGALMLALAEDGATRFIVVTSRRTPREATDALREVITDRRVVRQFIEHGLARGSGIEPVLSLADAVLMTVDSPSMLTEAIAARRAVITLAPSDTQLDENDVAFRAFLEGEGWMRALPLGLATPETIDAALTEIIPQTDDCVGALAQHLRQVLLPRLRR